MKMITERLKDNIETIIGCNDSEYKCLDIRNLSKYKLFKGINLNFIKNLENKKYLASNFEFTTLIIHDKLTSYDRCFDNQIKNVLFSIKGYNKLCLDIVMKDEKKYKLIIEFELIEKKLKAIRFYNTKGIKIKGIYLKWKEIEIVSDLMSLETVKRDIDNFFINLIMEN